MFLFSLLIFFIIRFFFFFFFCFFFFFFFFFLYFFFFFFFSSRRRHTRWNCDWSSDVCSSDLDDFDIRQRFGIRFPISRATRKLWHFRNEGLIFLAPVNNYLVFRHPLSPRACT